MAIEEERPCQYVKEASTFTKQRRSSRRSQCRPIQIRDGDFCRRFDAWADQCGYYTLNCEQATLLEARNKLKKKINISASSPAWLKQDETPFFIAVSQYGKTYAVKRAEEAFSDKAVRLPAQVKVVCHHEAGGDQSPVGKHQDQCAPGSVVAVRISSFDREIEALPARLSTTADDGTGSRIQCDQGAVEAAARPKMIAPNGDDHLLQLMGIEADD